jgi:hypothetical protein
VRTGPFRGSAPQKKESYRLRQIGRRRRRTSGQICRVHQAVGRYQPRSEAGCQAIQGNLEEVAHFLSHSPCFQVDQTGIPSLGSDNR